MKKYMNFVLARHPKIYETILSLKGNVNLDKMIFLKLVKNGDVVFDVGANEGYYTILFSHLVGKTGEVHAFEPLPPTFKQLSRKVYQQKRYDNIYLNNAAVSDINGTVSMYMPGTDHRQASLAIHQEGSWSNVKDIANYQCQAIKLDEYIQSIAKERLDFVKLDVEGAEMLALLGFGDSISKFLPVIYLELCQKWTKNFNYSPIDIVNLLSQWGYLKFYLVTNKIQLLQHPYQEIVGEKFLFSANLLCAIPGHHDIRINRIIQ